MLSKHSLYRSLRTARFRSIEKGSSTVDNTTADGSIDDVAANLIFDQEPAEEVEVLEADDQEDQAEEVEADEADEADEDADDADDSVEDADAEDVEEADEEPASLYTVKVNGEEKQVTLDELRRGYSGQEYIQQQMRQVAEGRKQVEAIYNQLQQEAQQVATLRQRLETGGIPAQPQPPTRDLFEKDPIGYMEAKLKYDEDVAAWQGQVREMEAVTSRQRQMQEQALAYTLQQEMAKLTQVLPEIADPQKGPQVRKAIIEVGIEYGFAPDEIAQVVDSRQVRVLHDAMKYRQMMAAKDGTYGYQMEIITYPDSGIAAIPDLQDRTLFQEVFADADRR
jgi:hypothetical protein